MFSLLGCAYEGEFSPDHRICPQICRLLCVEHVENANRPILYLVSDLGAELHISFSLTFPPSQSNSDYLPPNPRPNLHLDESLAIIKKARPYPSVDVRI